MNYWFIFFSTWTLGLNAKIGQVLFCKNLPEHNFTLHFVEVASQTDHTCMLHAVLNLFERGQNMDQSDKDSLICCIKKLVTHWHDLKDKKYSTFLFKPKRKNFAKLFEILVPNQVCVSDALKIQGMVSDAEPEGDQVVQDFFAQAKPINFICIYQTQVSPHPIFHAVAVQIRRAEKKGYYDIFVYDSALLNRFETALQKNPTLLTEVKIPKSTHITLDHTYSYLFDQLEQANLKICKTNLIQTLITNCQNFIYHDSEWKSEKAA